MNKQHSAVVVSPVLAYHLKANAKKPITNKQAIVDTILNSTTKIDNNVLNIIKLIVPHNEQLPKLLIE